jgi:peptidoglycan/xylan/chitin deacetylase (PgdA/CDA1 family)
MLTVSNYHYIRENFEAKFPSIFGVTPVSFKKQLLLLNETGIFIHPSYLVDNVDEILKSEQNYILITFDDGLKEQFDIALPILTELNIPAIFFINSINHVEKKVSLVHKIHLVRSVVSTVILYEKLIYFTGKNLSLHEVKKAHEFYRFDDYLSAEFKYFLNVLLDYNTQEKFINDLFLTHFDENEVLEKLYMNTNEVIELIKLGFVGSHTHSHFPLGVCNLEIISDELITSKKYLESIGNAEINFVAYPYGTNEAVTETVLEIAKVVGYKLGFTTKIGVNESESNLLLLNRFDCNDLIGGKNYK